MASKKKARRSSAPNALRLIIDARGADVTRDAHGVTIRPPKGYALREQLADLVLDIARSVEPERNETEPGAVRLSDPAVATLVRLAAVRGEKFAPGRRRGSRSALVRALEEILTAQIRTHPGAGNGGVFTELRRRARERGDDVIIKVDDENRVVVWQADARQRSTTFKAVENHISRLRQALDPRAPGALPRK
jgi:hypothetical protein